MRLREPVPASEALGPIGPFLLSASAAGPVAAAAGLLSAFASPESSDPQSLAFVGPRTRLRARERLVAALVLVEADPVAGAGFLPEGLPSLAVTSLHAAIAALLRAFEPRLLRPAPFASGPGNQVAPTAVVEGILEGGVTVGAGAVIGRGSYIGAGTRIEPNAVIQEHCVVGRHCLVQSGAVIGCAGFGFFARPRFSGDAGARAPGTAAESPATVAGRPTLGAGQGGLELMPHLGGVEIGDDCFIGAQTVIAAGVLGPTTLGRGCKLDSHVQVAHNVRLGEDALLASQSGIAGSTIIGKRFRMGGAASVDGHLELGDDVSVAACSGVTKDLPSGAVVAGFPALPIREWRRREALLRQRASQPE